MSCQAGIMNDQGKGEQNRPRNRLQHEWRAARNGIAAAEAAQKEHGGHTAAWTNAVSAELATAKWEQKDAVVDMVNEGMHSWDKADQ
eukprot:12948753-Heterocapsa_arctica.AAC.1